MAGRGRGGSGDPDFGSDSFLDIVANLVGILIILIVLAGLRASQAPLQPDELPGMADAAPIDDKPAEPLAPKLPRSNDPPHREPVVVASEPVSPDPDDEPIEPVFAESDSEVADATPDPPPFTGVTEEDAQKQLAGLKDEVRQAEARLAELDVAAAWDDTKKLQERLAASSARLRSLQNDVAKQAFLARQDARLAREANAEAARLRVRLEDVNRQLEQLSQLDTPDEPIEIRINPIGRASTGKEVWFLVDSGTVAVLPVDDLHYAVHRRLSNSMKFRYGGHRYTGAVGPVDGVRYEFAAMRVFEPVSTPNGQATESRSLVNGELIPDETLHRESISQAVTEGGILIRTLLQAPRGAVVRFIITVDDFEHAHAVARVSRDLGFLVSMSSRKAGEPIILGFGRGSDAVAQ